MNIDKNNVIYGGPVATSVTNNCGSLGQFALKQLKEAGKKVILIDGTTREEFTSDQLYKSAIQMAQCLQNMEIKSGDVVGICSENRMEFAVVALATLCLNATVAPINVSYTEREISHAINLSRPKIVFISEIFAGIIGKLLNENTFIKKFVFIGKGDNIINEHKTVTYDNFLKEYDPFSHPFLPQATDIYNNVALIVCSSGTTGMPKGVQLTQKNVLTVVDRQFERLKYTQNCTFLSVIPWFHSYGCLTLIGNVCIGEKLVFFAKFEENIFLRSIQDYKVNVAFMVPPLMVFLAKHPAVSKYDLSSLEVLFCGAAPLSKDTEDAVKKRIGVPSIRQGYGLSESTLGVLAQTDEYNKPGSVGIIRAGLYCKVVDTETGKSLGAYERGELCFKGDLIMKGYVNDEKSTNETIDENGWLHTGDIGFYDNDLEFFIVDRIKELIKYKGFQVPPAEIESILLSHPDIKDAGVVGLPNEASGELPFAFVVKQSNAKISRKEIFDYVAERVSHTKKLRGGIRFVDVIPKNASGKILRRVLREMIKPDSKSKL